ncbi:hypothetical protein ABPG74_016185 [Tetrahymena malaccensis]
MKFVGLLDDVKKVPYMSIYYSALHSSSFSLGIVSFIYFLKNSYTNGIILLGMLLLCRAVSITLSVVSIYKNKKLKFFIKLFKNLFYFDDQYIYRNTYLISFGMKHFLYFYIQSIFVLIIIVSQNIEDYSVIFCFLVSSLSSVSLFFTEDIVQSSSKLNSLIMILNNFLGMTIVLGFLLVCHQIDYFFFYNIIIFLLYFVLRDLKRPIKSLIGSKYDVVSPNQMFMIVFCFLSAQYFGLMRMNQSKKNSRSYLLSNNYKYLINGYMSIIVLIQLVLDRQFNNLENLQNLRRILYIFTFIFIPFFADIFLNMINFLRFGPYERWMQIDCSKFSNLTFEQIKRQFLKLKKNQFQINLYIKQIEWEAFDNLLKVCLEEKEKNFKLEYHYETINKNESLEIENNTIQTKITLNLYSIEFTKNVMISLNKIRKNVLFSFKFHFVNPLHVEKKFQIFKELFKYPHLFAMHEEQLEFCEVKQIIPIIKEYQRTMLQIFTFNSYIQSFLTINPTQVIYDLLLDVQ